MQEIRYTEAERQFPRVRLMPDRDGTDECPDCHGRGTKTQRNFATLSPSDDCEAECETCAGEGVVRIVDDR